MHRGGGGENSKETSRQLSRGERDAEQRHRGGSVTSATNGCGEEMTNDYELVLVQGTTSSKVALDSDSDCQSAQYCQGTRKQQRQLSNMWYERARR